MHVGEEGGEGGVKCMHAWMDGLARSCIDMIACRCGTWHVACACGMGALGEARTSLPVGIGLPQHERRLVHAQLPKVDLDQAAWVSQAGQRLPTTFAAAVFIGTAATAG